MIYDITKVCNMFVLRTDLGTTQLDQELIFYGNGKEIRVNMVLNNFVTMSINIPFEGELRRHTELKNHGVPFLLGRGKSVPKLCIPLSMMQVEVKDGKSLTTDDYVYQYKDYTFKADYKTYFGTEVMGNDYVAYTNEGKFCFHNGLVTFTHFDTKTETESYIARQNLITEINEVCNIGTRFNLDYVLKEIMKHYDITRKR